jgi:hypothetical protein
MDICRLECEILQISDGRRAQSRIDHNLEVLMRFPCARMVYFLRILGPAPLTSNLHQLLSIYDGKRNKIERHLPR